MLISKGWCVLFSSLLTTEWVRYYILAIMFYCFEGLLIVRQSGRFVCRCSTSKRRTPSSFTFYVCSCLRFCCMRCFSRRAVLLWRRELSSRCAIQNENQNGAHVSGRTESLRSPHVVQRTDFDADFPSTERSAQSILFYY